MSGGAAAAGTSSSGHALFRNGMDTYLTPKMRRCVEGESVPSLALPPGRIPLLAPVHFTEDIAIAPP